MAIFGFCVRRLPASTNPNFCERLAAQIKLENANSVFRFKAEALLVVIDKQFGVIDFFDPL